MSKPLMMTPQRQRRPASIHDLDKPILREIFWLATDANRVYPVSNQRDSRRYTPFMSRMFSPLNLIHVCRKWRALALRMKSLWAQLRVDEFTYGALTFWLKFSNPEPLYLAYTPSLTKILPIHPDPVRAYWIAITAANLKLPAITQYGGRWKSLHLVLETPDHDSKVEFMLNTASSRGSPLEKLSLRSCPRSSQVAVHSWMRLISMLPRLQDLTWTYLPSPNNPVSLPRCIRWERLRVVNVETAFTIDDAMWVLSKCTSAVHVGLYGAPCNRPYVAREIFAHPPIPITLPNLQTLHVRIPHTEPGYLLQHLVCPSLTTLEVSPLLSLTTATVQDFFTHSKCPLSTFKVNDWNQFMTNTDIIDCLAIPYLTDPTSFVPYVAIVPRFAPVERYGEILMLARARNLARRPELWHEEWDDPSICFWYNIGWREQTY